MSEIFHVWDKAHTLDMIYEEAELRHAWGIEGGSMRGGCGESKDNRRRVAYYPWQPMQRTIEIKTTSDYAGTDD